MIWCLVATQALKKVVSKVSFTTDPTSDASATGIKPLPMDSFSPASTCVEDTSSTAKAGVQGARGLGSGSGSGDLQGDEEVYLNFGGKADSSDAKS